MILANKTRALYERNFGAGDTTLFYSHGRLEIVGNHTDHQGGCCLVAGCDLGITAVAAPNPDGAIKVLSQGYDPFMFHLDELNIDPLEYGSTKSLF